MRFLLFDCTVPAVPGTRLNSACGTWDKIEICLRYHNRTLPWTLRKPGSHITVMVPAVVSKAEYDYGTAGRFQSCPDLENIRKAESAPF